MLTRETLIAEALTWQGTPYAKLQCCKGIGIDCAGLLWHFYVAHTGKAPWHPYNAIPRAYAPLLSTEWERHTQREYLLEVIRARLVALEEIGLQDIMPGDFIVTGPPGKPSNHVSILLPDEHVLHAVIYRAGAILMRQQRHAALRRTERTAFTFFHGESHGNC